MSNRAHTSTSGDGSARPHETKARLQFRAHEKSHAHDIEHRGPGAASWRSGTRGRVERDADGYPTQCGRCRTGNGEQRIFAACLRCHGHAHACHGIRPYRYYEVRPGERSRRNHLRRLKDEARRARGGR